MLDEEFVKLQVLNVLNWLQLCTPLIFHSLQNCSVKVLDWFGRVCLRVISHGLRSSCRSALARMLAFLLAWIRLQQKFQAGYLVIWTEPRACTVCTVGPDVIHDVVVVHPF